MTIQKNDLVRDFAKEVAHQKSKEPNRSSIGDKAKRTFKTITNSSPAQRKQWLIAAMKLAKAIGTDIPSRSSTPLGAVFQSIGAIDTIRSAIWKDTADPVAQYANQRGMEKYTNNTFVRMFFDTDLHTKFVLFTVRITDYKELIDAQGPLGRFAFTKSDYSTTYDSTYYMGPDVQMGKVLDGLWTQYDGRLHINITPNIYGRGEAEFSAFQSIDSPLFGSANLRMESLLIRHRKYQSQKIPRSYMCYGPPGTGKTSFAMKFAEKLGTRTLKLGAVSLNHISVKELDYILRHLAPEFLIIDDVDKIQTGNALPTLLDIVQRFKTGDGQTTLLLTANTITDFDTGFFRPNRIDTWIEFTLPELDERKAVISSYAERLSLDMSGAALELLASKSEGLSHDYLREIVSELKQCGSLDEILKLIVLMKRLLQQTVPKEVKK